MYEADRLFQERKGSCGVNGLRTAARPRRLLLSRCADGDALDDVGRRNQRKWNGVGNKCRRGHREMKCRASTSLELAGTAWRKSIGCKRPVAKAGENGAEQGRARHTRSINKG
ncbi:hypothetical protein TRVL_04014 [Trypanosoma vivax]|nr:hypothetical protein TRVL_04014 [Trypanosoma vivax]